MHDEEDLGGPGPLQDERPANPHGKPQGLENTLDDDASFVPSKDVIAAHIESMQWYAQVGGRCHGEVTETKPPYILGKKMPLTDDEWEPGLLVVP